MAKEAKKTAKKKAGSAAKAEKAKKNPLIDADEDTTEEETTEEEETEEETDEETADEAEDEEASDDDESDEEEDEDADEEVEEDDAEEEAPAPKKAKAASAPVPAEKVNVVSALASDIAVTKAKIDKEPKVHFMIPLAEGEKAGAVHDCFINGHKVTVKKGVMTKVPKSIADLLANHYKVTAEAGSDFRLDLNERKQDALS